MLILAGGSSELDRTVEQVPPDASGPPEGDLGQPREGGCELLRVAVLLRELESRFGVPHPVRAASARARHPRKPAEDVDPFAGLEARLGQRPSAEDLGGAEPLRLPPHPRKATERLRSGRSAARRAEDSFEQLGSSGRVARVVAMLGGPDAPSVELVDVVGRSHRDSKLGELRCGQHCAAGAGVRRSRVEGGRDLLVRADHRDGKMARSLFEIEVELREPTMEATSPVERHPGVAGRPQERMGELDPVAVELQQTSSPRSLDVVDGRDGERFQQRHRGDGKGGNGDERLADACGQRLQAGRDDALQALGE